VSADDDLWGVINEADWQALPYVTGRVGTHDDIADGSAVFSIETDKPHAPHPLALPCCALEHRSDGSVAAVVVIQAEAFNGKIFLGVRYIGGGNDVCTLDEIELLQEPTNGFFAYPSSNK
jgi:hypothetical protein